MKLPVTAEYLAEAARGELCFGRDVSLLVVQHLLEDTQEFLRLLEQVGLDVAQVVGIEYSGREEIARSLRSRGVRVEVPALEGMERVLEEILRELISERHGRKLLIQEVGGYCAGVLARLDGRLDGFLSVVEETSQGVWRYRELCADRVAVLQIAESKLKELECRFVGAAVARAIEEDLTVLGRSLIGCRVGVLGLGRVGMAVAESLRDRGAVVWCHDLDHVALIRAHIAGFGCPSRDRILAHSDVLVGASGRKSLSSDEFRLLKDECLLASASSKTVEFPIQELEVKSMTVANKNQESFVTTFEMSWGKTIRVACGGRPVNFRNMSLPWPIADLLFCQIAASIKVLLTTKLAPGLYPLSPSDQNVVARLWWDRYGSSHNSPLLLSPATTASS